MIKTYLSLPILYYRTYKTSIARRIYWMEENFRKTFKSSLQRTSYQVNAVYQWPNENYGQED